MNLQEQTYRIKQMIGLLTDKFGDKIKEYYHINCV